MVFVGEGGIIKYDMGRIIGIRDSEGTKKRSGHKKGIHFESFGHRLKNFK